MLALPLTSREIKLVRRPDHTPGPEHFEIVASPMPRPAADEVLVRNRWFRISISARLMMSAGAQDIKGIPFPPINPGDTLADGARFVLLGALSAELAAKGATKVAPMELDSFQLILKGMTLRGYSADNDPDAFNEWIERLAVWQRDGGLHLLSSKFSGIESAPQALHEACIGRLRGLVYVEL